MFLSFMQAYFGVGVQMALSIKHMDQVSLDLCSGGSFMVDMGACIGLERGMALVEAIRGNHIPWEGDEINLD